MESTIRVRDLIMGECQLLGGGRFRLNQVLPSDLQLSPIGYRSNGRLWITHHVWVLRKMGLRGELAS